MPEFRRSRPSEASRASFKSGRETVRRLVKFEDRRAVKENASKALWVYVNFFAKVLLAVFLTTTTGVHRRVVQITHGTRTLVTGDRTTTTIRTTTIGFGLCGVLNKQVYRPDDFLSGRYT